MPLTLTPVAPDSLTLTGILQIDSSGSSGSLYGMGLYGAGFYGSGTDIPILPSLDLFSVAVGSLTATTIWPEP